MIIDAHAHLWDVQNGLLNGRPVHSLGGGRSDFGGETRQMLPPSMLDGHNGFQALLSNMDYAGVSGAVITQEVIDGNQDAYLLRAKAASNGRLQVCSLWEESASPALEGFDGVKLCAGRLKNPDLTRLMEGFQAIERAGLFLSVDLADGDAQTASMLEVIEHCPSLRVAIGHFGMANRPGWLSQVALAHHPNVIVESGGITWLFHSEFYPYPSAIAAIRKAAQLCGMRKLAWGSDYPRTMTAITYRMSLDFILRSGALTPDEQDWFLGGTARAFYRFPALPIPPRVKSMVED